jgi:hypothetical protein
MVKSNKLEHLYKNIEDYFDDEVLDDEMSYLGLDSDGDFKDYFDYRATRKHNRKEQEIRGSRGETSHRNVPDDWADYQYG